MENLKKFIDEVKGEQERTNEELIEELEDIILGIQRFYILKMMN